MMRTVEGTHVVFLSQIMGRRDHITIYGTWGLTAAGEVLREYGMHTAAIYIGHRQSMELQ